MYKYFELVTEKNQKIHFERHVFLGGLQTWWSFECK